MSDSFLLADTSVSEIINPTGRRRRAAAEQRRTEHEIWRHLVQNIDEDIYVVPPPPPISRRQLRRATRRSSTMRVDGDANDDHLEVALDHFLSSLQITDGGNERTPNHVYTLRGEDTSTSILYSPPDQTLDMSYESLVMLENVQCTTPAATVRSLCGHIFDKDGSIINSLYVDGERCTICQMEFMIGVSCMLLPCLHMLHDVCGSEWFIKYSKLCPVCKRDITRQA